MPTRAPSDRRRTGSGSGRRSAEPQQAGREFSRLRVLLRHLVIINSRWKFFNISTLEREREDKKNFSEEGRLPLNAHCVVSQQHFPSDICILEIFIGHPHGQVRLPGSFLAEVHVPPPHPTPTPPHLPCFSTDALVCFLTPRRRSRPTATGCVSLSDREMNWRGVRLRLHKGAGTGFL